MVTGRNTDRARALLDALKKEGVAFELFAMEGEPTVAAARAAAEQARRERERAARATPTPTATPRPTPVASRPAAGGAGWPGTYSNSIKWKGDYATCYWEVTQNGRSLSAVTYVAEKDAGGNYVRVDVPGGFSGSLSDEMAELVVKGKGKAVAQKTADGSLMLVSRETGSTSILDPDSPPRFKAGQASQANPWTGTYYGRETDETGSVDIAMTIKQSGNRLTASAKVIARDNDGNVENDRVTMSGVVNGSSARMTVDDPEEDDESTANLRLSEDGQTLKASIDGETMTFKRQK